MLAKTTAKIMLGAKSPSDGTPPTGAGKDTILVVEWSWQEWGEARLRKGKSGEKEPYSVQNPNHHAPSYEYRIGGNGSLRRDIAADESACDHTTATRMYAPGVSLTST